ncbi:hypothetical protein DPMN_068129 [Dreissena polymorpha]|uniref:Uncharacterized protein n=1 Tax=Dreissena polymorpha TaxID=45954 RepID=A0A9D3Z0I8_DREPO|nr:hypothetical protein DPMN_068128 [Dreissena polymorpha]KAH3708672.1 hypothetical protein DPMN_068129 [Dreissena polymorpha]
MLAGSQRIQNTILWKQVAEFSQVLQKVIGSVQSDRLENDLPSAALELAAKCYQH